MLPESEVVALTEMLAKDGADDVDLDLLESLTGLPVETTNGTVKRVWILGKQWVVKVRAWECRDGAIDSEDVLDTLPSHLLRHFARTIRIGRRWTIQEYLEVNEFKYNNQRAEINEILRQTKVRDVWYCNVGFRKDGSWQIFDFDKPLAGD